MKINTDLVKGKKYCSAIKPNTLKHSQEYRVLATLRYLYPSKFDTMITGEAPDLQDSASSTGIEVTAAVKEDDMKVSRAFSELNQGKPKDMEKRKNLLVQRHRIHQRPCPRRAIQRRPLGARLLPIANQERRKHHILRRHRAR